MLHIVFGANFYLSLPLIDCTMVNREKNPIFLKLQEENFMFFLKTPQKIGLHNIQLQLI